MSTSSDEPAVAADLAVTGGGPAGPAPAGPRPPGDAPSGPAGTASAAVPDRFGPVRVHARLGDAYGAVVYSGEVTPGEGAVVFAWGSDELDAGQTGLVATIIEQLQDRNARGAARLLHGSVAAHQTVLAFERPPGERLSDRLMRGTASAVEAISGALSLVEGLTALTDLGVPPGWWSPEHIWVPTDQPTRWTLTEPGVAVLAMRGGRPAPRDLAEAAVCAPELATGSVAPTTDDSAARAAMLSYGVGATLFYVLSGELPKSASDPGGYLRRQLAADPRKLSEPVPHLARYSLLVRLIDDCLQRAPGERPSDLGELRRRLVEARHEAERLDSDVAFLPARVTDTMEIRRSMLRERTDEHPLPQLPDRRVQFGALAMLVAILVFLIARQASSHVRADRDADAPREPSTLQEPAVPEATAPGRRLRLGP